MSGYLVTGNKKECFGCGACFQACHEKAISMKEDAEGFLYPSVDISACVACNICHSVCPAENRIIKAYPQKALVGYSVDAEIRKNSASGGAFDAIIESCSEETSFFGVVWKNRSHAIHCNSDKRNAYTRFSKSKYVQSDTEQTYSEAKTLLNEGRSAVYTGTPCQIAGLKGFMGREYDNLFCVDLVCHGTPSSKVLERYMISNENRNHLVSDIDFREKVFISGKHDSKCAVLHFTDGKKKTVNYENSGYLRGFACGLFFRPSCLECPFACAERVSDLTIGDAWGIEKTDPMLDPHEGVSLILVNSEKGNKLAERLNKSMRIKEISIDQMVSGNGRLNSPDKGHPLRNEFFSRFENEDFEILLQEIIPKISFARKVGHEVKRLFRR